MPYLTMVCVCPPQTSMIVHGRVTDRAMAAASLPAVSPSRYSSMILSWRGHLQLVELLHLSQEVEDSAGLDLVDGESANPTWTRT